MPPAIAPGIDLSDGANTSSYDGRGIFTGSVTIVDGIPIATYPGEVYGGDKHADNWCEASPANLSDPLLTVWKKSPLNPLGNDTTMKTTGGPLGCTAAWKEPSGNWTTTIQSNRYAAGELLSGALPPSERVGLRT